MHFISIQCSASAIIMMWLHLCIAWWCFGLWVWPEGMWLGHPPSPVATEQSLTLWYLAQTTMQRRAAVCVCVCGGGWCHSECVCVCACMRARIRVCVCVCVIFNKLDLVSPTVLNTCTYVYLSFNTYIYIVHNYTRTHSWVVCLCCCSHHMVIATKETTQASSGVQVGTI